MLDLERGYWGKDTQAADADENDGDPMSQRTARVVPFVEDRKNCLVIEPAFSARPEEMASLQAALKNAIQVDFQLEDTELAAEPLPGTGNRRYLLLYESAEGGAGVLRRLVEDTMALARGRAARARDLSLRSGYRGRPGQSARARRSAAKPRVTTAL